MCPLKYLTCVIFSGLVSVNQTPQITATTLPKPKEIGEMSKLKITVDPKQTLQLSPLLQSWNSSIRKRDVQREKQIHRRGIPFQHTFLEVSENTESEVPVQLKKTTPLQYPLVPKLPAAKTLIRPNGTEAERAERIHKSFETLLTLVEIVGQIDNYVSSKWKNLVKTVSNFYEEEDEPYRLSAKRVYETCPNVQ